MRVYFLVSFEDDGDINMHHAAQGITEQLCSQFRATRIQYHNAYQLRVSRLRVTPLTEADCKKLEVSR